MVEITRQIRELAKAIIIDTSIMAALILRLEPVERARRGIDEWHVPGGSRDDPNDTLEGVVRREIKEETGFDDVMLVDELGSAEWDALYQRQPAHFTAKFFLFTRAGDGSRPLVELCDESDGYDWITENQAVDYEHLTDEARKYIPLGFERLREAGNV